MLQKVERGKQARAKFQENVAATDEDMKSATCPCGGTPPSDFAAVLAAVPDFCDGWKKKVLQQVASGPADATATLEVSAGKAKLVVKSGCGSSTSSIMWG